MKKPFSTSSAFAMYLGLLSTRAESFGEIPRPCTSVSAWPDISRLSSCAGGTDTVTWSLSTSCFLYWSVLALQLGFLTSVRPLPGT